PDLLLRPSPRQAASDLASGLQTRNFRPLASPLTQARGPKFRVVCGGGDASKRSAFEGAEGGVARRRCNTLPWARAAAARSNAEATLASQDVVAMPCRGL